MSPATASGALSGLRVGRFRLLAVLGRGRLATVWRAQDEQLQREVAIKLPHAELTPAQVDAWLADARAAAALNHPHVVHVFEAGRLEGRGFAVYELVPGQTLAQWLRGHGHATPHQAVGWVGDVADAVRAAHAQGLVHGHLAPEYVLIDQQAWVRVSGFRRPLTSSDASAATSAGAIHPSHAAMQGADLQAMGCLLARLLGMPEQAPGLPWHWPADAAADDRLKHLVQRAVQSADQGGFTDAGELHTALQAWLAPALGANEPEPGSGQATLNFLLRRMRTRSDFPALSARVLRIQRLARSEAEPLHRLTEEIVLDVALTQKLLRLVNSAHFRRDGRPVSTVSRAVALVGLAGIRNLALSLLLVEHMHDQAHAHRLKQAFLMALLAGQVAQALAATPQEAEDAFLCALFYNLGGLLAECYFPEEAEQVRHRWAVLQHAAQGRGDHATHPDVLQDQAAEQVLGLGYAALGMAVAQHWGLPDSLQACMLRPIEASPARAVTDANQRLRWLAVACHEAAQAIWASDEEALPLRLEAVVQRHGRALVLSRDRLHGAADAACAALAHMAPAMGLSFPRARPSPGAVVGAVGESPESGEVISASPDAFSDAAVALLTAGITDITDALATEGTQLNQVLRMVLETIFRALACRHVVFCLRDASGRQLLGRFGLGEAAVTVVPQVQVALRPAPGQAPDWVADACIQGRDDWVADALAPNLQQRLPVWLKNGLAPKAFLVLPLVMRAAPLALIYADLDQARKLGERERALLRTLRNQALMAFRQMG